MFAFIFFIVKKYIYIDAIKVYADWKTNSFSGSFEGSRKSDPWKDLKETICGQAKP